MSPLDMVASPVRWLLPALAVALVIPECTGAAALQAESSVRGAAEVAAPRESRLRLRRPHRPANALAHGELGRRREAFLAGSPEGQAGVALLAAYNRHHASPADLGPGPFPNLFWVEQPFTTAIPTMAPKPEQCSGCMCLFPQPSDFIQNGKINDAFTCLGGAGNWTFIPSLRWIADKGMQVGSLAVTVEDLDFPNGVGESSNSVHDLFWAANIPPNWTEINSQNVQQVNEEGNLIVTVGKPVGASDGAEDLCPTKGTHRYRATLWALKTMLGQRVNPNTASMAVKAILEGEKMAEVNYFGALTAKGRSLQQTGR